MELADPILLGFWDDRSDFVDQVPVKLCQCLKKKEKKKAQKSKVK